MAEAFTWSKESALLPSPESPTGHSDFPAAARGPGRVAPSPPPGNRLPRRPAARRTGRTGGRSSSAQPARTPASLWSRWGTLLRAARSWPPPRWAPAGPGLRATPPRTEAWSAAAASPGRNTLLSPAAPPAPRTGPGEVSWGRRCQSRAAPARNDSRPDPCRPSRPSWGAWKRKHRGQKCVTLPVDVLNKPFNRGHWSAYMWWRSYKVLANHAFIILQGRADVCETGGATLIHIRLETDIKDGTRYIKLLKN